MIGLVGCKTNILLAPVGTVPKRSAFTHDAYGGYITILTADNFSCSGELIGLRNDSIIVLADSVISIGSKNISKARIIVYSPNKYGAGFLLAVPNLGLLGLSGEYGGSPASLAVFLTVIDAIGISIAMSTENKKVNYYDWSEGWNEVMKYSRFPYGVPQNINISELKRRIIKSPNTK